VIRPGAGVRGAVAAVALVASAAVAEEHGSLENLCGYGPGYALQFPANVVGDSFSNGKLARFVHCQYDGTRFLNGPSNEGWVYEDLPGLGAAFEDANCTGACGAGCSQVTCHPHTYWTDWWDNGDGRSCHNQMTQIECYSHDYCYLHDLCGARFGFFDYECNAAALSVGIADCIGQGAIGCAEPGSYTKVFQQHVITTSCCSNACPPGGGFTECGDYCLPPCNAVCSPRCGQPDNCGGTCSNADDVCSECGTTNACGRYCGDCPKPCTGACYPRCGQPDGCGNTCSNADDVCTQCGTTNACGRYCGDCPPPCDNTCYSCGTWTGCGNYCGDCPPPCDNTCYSCGTWTSCGNYCGDCCDNTCWSCGMWTQCGYYCGDCDPCSDPCGWGYSQCWWLCGF
jgi:hypothetical protein